MYRLGCTQRLTHEVHLSRYLILYACRCCVTFCLMHILYPSPAITVEAFPPRDPPTAGQSYSLVCTVNGADSLNATITYQWFKTNPSQTQLGINSHILTFDPLVVSDAGHYSCEVIVSSDRLSRDITITSSRYEIRFSCKYSGMNIPFNAEPCRVEYTLYPGPLLQTSSP